jgi:cytochrome c oxidase subunit 2
MNRNRLVCAGRVTCVAVLVILGPPSGSSQDRKVVHVTAERYAFTPSQIKVKRGTEVEFRLTSEDTNHGFRILSAPSTEGGHANVIIPKRGRGEAIVIFRADTPGRYTFECSKMCGAGHTFMRGLITVVE